MKVIEVTNRQLTKPETRKLHIAVIILAGGFSFRMKSFKPLLPLGSVKVLERAVRSFQIAGFTDIRVIVGHKAAELISICDSLQVKPIFNENYPEGMFSSVKAGVASLGPEVDGFFLLPVDNPIIHEDTLHSLYEAFSLGTKGIVYPEYQGKRGHPPLISRIYKEEILNWSGEGGLRRLLEQYQADAIKVAIEDPGVLLDMDTPEDYRTILKYCGYAPIPTEVECYEMLEANNTPQQVIEHCEMVARLSVLLGQQLNEAGQHFDLGLLRSSALLHDIARVKSHHAQEGAKLTAAFPEVSDIIAYHMDSQWNPSQSLTEKEIVYLADKMVTDTQIISLQERLSKAIERHKDDPGVQRKIYRRFYQAYIIKYRIEEILGELDAFIKLKLGRDVHG